MTDDEQRVFEDNVKLRAEVERLKKARPWISITHRVVWSLASAVATTVSLVALGYALFFAPPKPRVADPQVDYCYPQMIDYQHTALAGHLEGLTDIRLSVHGSLDDVVKAARQIDCPLMHPRGR